MLILGIETSCDETAASVAEGRGGQVRILSNVVSSQISLHQKWGGVVPEIAAREHVLKILPVIDEALDRAGIARAQAGEKLDALAIAEEPGLITSLLVGRTSARALALAWDLSLFKVNHIYGHICANFIGQDFSGREAELFPALVLTVSGGHTLLALMDNFRNYRVIGETRDDAAGEAFDKAAQLLGLAYPGGPALAAAATKAAGGQSGIALPRPMLDSPDLDFSFSGLKTALRYALEQDKDWRQRVPEYSAAFQAAVIDVLWAKVLKAARQHRVKSLLLAGGVSANQALRSRISAGSAEHLPGTRLFIPALEYTTDNAAMIAAAAYFQNRSWSEISKK